jgi:hypothetical protein
MYRRHIVYSFCILYWKRQTDRDRERRERERKREEESKREKESEKKKKLDTFTFIANLKVLGSIFFKKICIL